MENYFFIAQAESTWNAASVEMEEFVGRTISNTSLSGWCSLFITLHERMEHLNPISGHLLEYILQQIEKALQDMLIFLIWEGKKK